MTRIIMHPRDGQGGYQTTWFETGKAAAVYEHPAVTFPDSYLAQEAHPQRLYLTAGGRWALETGANSFQWIDPDRARDWLISIRVPDDEIARHFDPVEDERGPGRPKVGEQVCFTVPVAHLAAVDALAADQNLGRSAVLRDAVAAYVAPAAGLLFSRARHDLNGVREIKITGWPGRHAVAIHNIAGETGVCIEAPMRHEGDRWTYTPARDGVLECFSAPVSSPDLLTPPDRTTLIVYLPASCIGQITVTCDAGTGESS